jgi:hypothetical protein
MAGQQGLHSLKTSTWPRQGKKREDLVDAFPIGLAFDYP